MSFLTERLLDSQQTTPRLSLPVISMLKGRYFPISFHYLGYNSEIDILRDLRTEKEVILRTRRLFFINKPMTNSYNVELEFHWAFEALKLAPHLLDHGILHDQQIGYMIIEKWDTDYLTYAPRLSSVDKKRVDAAIDSSIDTFHVANLFHGDLNSSNIVLRGYQGYLEIAFIDFEMSRFISTLAPKDATFYTEFLGMSDNVPPTVENVVAFEKIMYK